MAKPWAKFWIVPLVLLGLGAAGALGPLGSLALAQQPAAAENTRGGTRSPLRSKRAVSKVGDFFNPKPAAKVPEVEDDAISLKSKSKPGPELYVAVARLYEQSHKLADAEQQYQLALKDKPDYLPALLGYAELKEQLGPPDEALRLYQRAAQAYPREPAVYNNMGLYYAKLGRADEAVATLARAVALAPKNPRYRNNIATVLVDQGRLQDAFAHFQAAYGEAAAYYNVGYLLNKKGQTQAAMQHFALALKADPSMVAAQRWLDYLQRSTGAGAAIATSGGQRREDHQRTGAGGSRVAVRRADAPPAAANPVGRSAVRWAIVAGHFSGPLGPSHGPDAAGERQCDRCVAAPNKLKPARWGRHSCLPWAGNMPAPPYAVFFRFSPCCVAESDTAPFAAVRRRSHSRAADGWL